MDNEFDGHDEDLSQNLLTQILKAFTASIEGRDVSLEIENGYYSDWRIAVNVDNNSVDFYGDYDGPLNGYNPIFKTNIFSMEEEKDYYLYIDDRLGQGGATAELYMDLKKVTAE